MKTAPTNYTTGNFTVKVSETDDREYDVYKNNFRIGVLSADVMEYSFTEGVILTNVDLKDLYNMCEYLEQYFA